MIFRKLFEVIIIVNKNITFKYILYEIKGDYGLGLIECGYGIQRG